MKWFESNLSKKTITFSPRISKDLTSVEIISLDESYNRLPFLNSVANKERSISALEGGGFSIVGSNKSILSYDYSNQKLRLNPE